MLDPSVKNLKVKSTAFDEGEMIPSEYTCDGENVSPDLSWKGAPGSVKSYAILVVDPDIPIPKFLIPEWVHWVVYNIPPEVTSIPRAFPKEASSVRSVKQGVTSYKKPGYHGPCPPFGTHRYYFKVYALDITLDLEPGKATRKKILAAINGHVLAYGELMGKYKRRK
ncbi:MAG: YbhB/YbcL family Raf kinase inhibitor-like protein [Desulfobacterales bacterium]